jgi:DNA-binding PadR family transcriptional regulator
MDFALATSTALLQALREGPGYGLELLARVRRASGERCRIGVGSAYPALAALGRKGLVRRWTIIPGRRRGGRSRTYYELTYSGLMRSEQDAAALRGVLARHARSRPRRRPSPALLRQRLDRVCELFDFIDRLHSTRSRR